MEDEAKPPVTPEVTLPLPPRRGRPPFRTMVEAEPKAPAPNVTNPGVTGQVRDKGWGPIVPSTPTPPVEPQPVGRVGARIAAEIEAGRRALLKRA